MPLCDTPALADLGNISDLLRLAYQPKDLPTIPASKFFTQPLDGNRGIHFLVWLPAAKERHPEPSHIVAALTRISMMQTLNFDNVTNVSNNSARESFKTPLKAAYGFFDSSTRSDLWDMSTGQCLRHGCVIAAHIFQYRWRLFLSILSDFKDINDARNGLLLYKPVEWAFDRAKIFIEVTKTGAMTFRLLDQSLRNVKLTDKAMELRKEGKQERPLSGSEVNLQETFGDLDGRSLQFPPDSNMRPSKRLLALHAHAAWLTFTSLNPKSEVKAPSYNESDDERTAHSLNHIINEWKKSLQSTVPLPGIANSLSEEEQDEVLSIRERNSEF